jgi:glycosyltransferase involved in cell wall biosynthesis
MGNSLNIVILSSDRYPDGGASANRHLAYSKGLCELGNSVTFILLGQQKDNKPAFEIDGIKFIGTFKKNPFSELFKNHGSLISVPSIPEGRIQLKKLIKKGKVDLVIVLDTHLWMLLPFLNLCKRHGTKVLHERTEYPQVALKRGLAGRFHYYLYRRFFLSRINGLFVISNALKRFFDEQVENKIPVQIINMMVDPSRFQYIAGNHDSESRYIAYCGAMDIEKDGVDILIRAFGKAINQIYDNSDMKLVLIGSVPERSLREKYNSIIRESKCEGRVQFTGYVNRERIPGLLNNATALALARPNSQQAEGGFPTKLGEYLATGKPTIITNTGEIGQFLRDGENAFVAEPGSVDSFTEKIVRLFNNYPEAAQIGLEGRELVNIEFNYLQQAKRLNDFILTLL